MSGCSEFFFLVLWLLTTSQTPVLAPDVSEISTNIIQVSQARTGRISLVPGATGNLIAKIGTWSQTSIYNTDCSFCLTTAGMKFIVTEISDNKQIDALTNWSLQHRIQIPLSFKLGIAFEDFFTHGGWT